MNSKQVRTQETEWLGPGETPHLYSPDYMLMGDCRHCGHVRDAHDDKKALSIILEKKEL